MWSMLFVVIINIGLNFLFIPKFGIKGAALASTIAYGVQAAFFVAIYKKFTHLNIGDILVVKKGDIQGLIRRTFER